MHCVKNFVRKFSRELRFTTISEDAKKQWSDVSDYREEEYEDAFEYLGEKITQLCQSSEKEILLFVDEVDKSLDNQVFLHFLGMLRNKYLFRESGRDYTFKSVILAGVYDVKNLKVKLRPEEERKYNSPWNIAVDFEVDMSFSPREIIYHPAVPAIELGTVLGIWKEKNGCIAISNLIFEQYLYDYSVVVKELKNKSLAPPRNQFIHDNHLDMELVLNKFQEFMRSEHRKKGR